MKNEPRIGTRVEPEQALATQVDTFEIDFRRFFQWVWAGRWIGAVVSIISAILIMLVIRGAPVKYTSTMLVTAAQPLSNGYSASSPLPTGIGSLLGGGGGNVSADPFSRYQALFLSAHVVRQVDRKYDLRKVLFRGWWDSRGHRWHAPSSLRELVAGVLRSLLGMKQLTRPDIPMLISKLKGDIAFNAGNQPGIYMISSTSGDPVLARNLLLWFNAATNQDIRNQSLEQAQENVKYLVDLLQRVSEQNQRAALASLLLSQERYLMLLKTGPVASNVIAPPEIPDRPDGKLAYTFFIIVVLSVFVGFTGAIFAGKWSEVRGIELNPPWKISRHLISS